jgi:hypothetical protein
MSPLIKVAALSSASVSIPKRAGFFGILALTFLASSALAQNVNVNPGGLTYATLQLAFTAINNGVHTGAVTVTIVGNTTEVGTATLNASGSGSASYTSISIQLALLQDR